MLSNRRVPRSLKIANTLGLILVLAVNALANILPINGLETGEISEFYPNLFTPAAITFSIWGVIYFFLLLFVMYNFDFIGKKSDKRVVESIGWYFFISCVLNAGWIILWHYLAIGASLIVMVMLLLVMLRIFHVAYRTESTDPNNRFFVRIPFSIYAGWITVATIANATAYLVHLQWGGWGISDAVWTLFMLAVATILVGITVLRYGSGSYGVVLIWTLAGIAWKHWTFFQMQYPSILIGCALCSLAIVLIIALMYATGREKSQSLL